MLKPMWQYGISHGKRNQFNFGFAFILRRIFFFSFFDVYTLPLDARNKNNKKLNTKIDIEEKVKQVTTKGMIVWDKWLTCVTSTVS